MQVTFCFATTYFALTTKIEIPICGKSYTIISRARFGSCVEWTGIHKCYAGVQCIILCALLQPRIVVTEVSTHTPYFM